MDKFPEFCIHIYWISTVLVILGCHESGLDICSFVSTIFRRMFFDRLVFMRAHQMFCYKVSWTAQERIVIGEDENRWHIHWRQTSSNPPCGVHQTSRYWASPTLLTFWEARCPWWIGRCWGGFSRMGGRAQVFVGAFMTREVFGNRFSTSRDELWGNPSTKWTGTADDCT